MKLLYIVLSFQHPDVRGPTRHYHLVRELSKRHEITLLALNQCEVGREALAEVTSYVDELHVFDVDRNDHEAVQKGAVILEGILVLVVADKGDLVLFFF